METWVEAHTAATPPALWLNAGRPRSRWGGLRYTGVVIAPDGAVLNHDLIAAGYGD